MHECVAPAEKAERNARGAAFLAKVGMTLDEFVAAGKLSFAARGLTDADVAAFAELCLGLGSGALKSCRELQLQGNQIGNDGMRSLADALAKGALPQLQQLFLSRNQIGDEGMAALADAIKPVGTPCQEGC